MQATAAAVRASWAYGECVAAQCGPAAGGISGESPPGARRRLGFWRTPLRAGPARPWLARRSAAAPAVLSARLPLLRTRLQPENVVEALSGAFRHVQ